MASGLQSRRYAGSTPVWPANIMSIKSDKRWHRMGWRGHVKWIRASDMEYPDMYRDKLREAMFDQDFLDQLNDYVLEPSENWRHAFRSLEGARD